MHIKICGITTLAQAQAALEAGADMLGFNFYPPSPRYLSPHTCARIVRTLRLQHPDLVCVGVFVNETPRRVRALMDACDLDLAQLAGDEPPEHLHALNGQAFKAVRPASPVEADSGLRNYARPAAPALLVDARVSGAFGGTGTLADPAIARHLAVQAPILLAGGLNPANVAAAIRTVRPWGVDVASGVESAPGIKDPDLMTAFVSAARAA